MASNAGGTRVCVRARSREKGVIAQEQKHRGWNISQWFDVLDLERLLAFFLGCGSSGVLASACTDGSIRSMEIWRFGLLPGHFGSSTAELPCVARIDDRVWLDRWMQRCHGEFGTEFAGNAVRSCLGCQRLVNPSSLSEFGYSIVVFVHNLL